MAVVSIIDDEDKRYEYLVDSSLPPIGKGGMGPNTEYACKNYKAIHCVFPAGNAVVAATEVEEIVDVHP